MAIIPTIFSDAAVGPFSFVAKSQPSGVQAQQFSVVVPAATAAGVNIGLIRFQRGFSLTGLAISVPDLDTGATVTLNVGFTYDTAAGDTVAAFFSANTVAQAGGSLVWPVANGLLTGTGFTAVDDGYLVINVQAGPTTTAGTVRGNASFTYNIV